MRNTKPATYAPAPYNNAHDKDDPEEPQEGQTDDAEDDSCSPNPSTNF
ncbi:MAG: hypothetical protein IIT36_05540 [Aeriscardovia sp.]|nr:hypothetical protein [Aeriscardovia sp.]